MHRTRSISDVDTRDAQSVSAAAVFYPISIYKDGNVLGSMLFAMLSLIVLIKEMIANKISTAVTQ